MIYSNTLSEIINNINTGIEYEIAMFYALLSKKPSEQTQVMNAILKRLDASKIKGIIGYTNTHHILDALRLRGLSLSDVTFETQDDEVGPADIVLLVKDGNNNFDKIGLSIKYANSCTLNLTGRNFLTNDQISKLKKMLPDYTTKYIQEMTSQYGNVNNWFRMRKPSKITDLYIDLIRDEVIKNWKNVQNKTALLNAMFHIDSPIRFWVVTYKDRDYILNTSPQTIDMCHAEDVTVEKYQTSYVRFYHDGKIVGHMQVKFNNGFIEKCKKTIPDVTHQGVRMAYGQPFSSWNFSVYKQ